MSYATFFSFSSGLARPMLVPHGTLAACLSHLADVERRLGIELETYEGETRWATGRPAAGVDDGELCHVATEHNRFVRFLHGLLSRWSEEARKEKPPIPAAWRKRRWPDPRDVGDYAYETMHGPLPEPETLTPEGAASFWRGLRDIDVPAGRWTGDYYRDRMQHAYEVLRGRESEGVTLNARRSLSPRQAAAVVCLFAEWLDPADLRLDVPNGCDYLASSSDGGYDWCEKCGPMNPDRVGGCRRKACPLLAERDAEEPEFARRWVVKDKDAREYLGRPDAREKHASAESACWRPSVDRLARRFDDRNAAEAAAREAGAASPARRLVVVPLARP